MGIPIHLGLEYPKSWMVFFAGTPKSRLADFETSVDKCHDYDPKMNRSNTFKVGPRRPRSLKLVFEVHQIINSRFIPLP